MKFIQQSTTGFVTGKCENFGSTQLTRYYIKRVVRPSSLCAGHLKCSWRYSNHFQRRCWTLVPFFLKFDYSPCISS